MPEYVIDEFAQESYSDESINVNRVLSWRASVREHSTLTVRFDDSWIFDSQRSPSERCARLLHRLRGL